MKFILTCSICLGNLQHPVSLHCGHTFCQICIQTSFSNSEACLCPLCRSTAYIQAHQTDQILPQVQQIYESDGTQGVLNEFPSLIICLCCGLTPINPVVLQCQHMFCQQCLSENMEEEQICPACQEFSINLEVHVNTKYQDLINWYLKESAIEEEPIQQLTYNLNNYNGLPVFFSDRSVPILQNVEFNFLEQRYQELVKITGQGSGHFVIVNSELESQDFGDLVKITRLTKIKKGYLVKVQGICRVNIANIYTYKLGNKLFIGNCNNQELNSNLWLCECQRRNDIDIKFNIISANWEVIVQTLNILFDQLSNNLKQHFQRLMKEINKQRQTNKEYQDITLILISILNGVHLKQYYDLNILERLQSIQIHFSQVEQQFHDSYYAPNIEDNAKLQKNKENNQKQINITLYPNLDLQSQYFLNLFDLQKILHL